MAARGNPFGGRTPAAPELPGRSVTVDPLGPVPEGRIPDSGAQAMNSFADRIEALSNDQFNRAAHQVATTAWEAGLVAGEKNPGVQMSGGGRVYQDAFNRAATDSGLRRLEVNGRSRLDELAKEHATNPAGFAAAAQAFRDGTAQELPPAIAARFLTNYDAWTRPYINHVTQQQERFVRDQDLAGLQQAMPLREAARDAAARAVAVDPRAADDLRREDETFKRDLIGRGPREAFSFDGVDYPADATRTGSLRLVEMSRLWSGWTETGRAQVVLGAANAAPDFATFLRDWEAQHMGSRPRVSAGGYADRVVQIESAGDANARNPRSTATGAGQFVEGTWLRLIRKYRPDMAEGKTDQQLLALRGDKSLATEMVDAYRAENAPALQAAGFANTDANAYLAHWFGPAGAVQVLKAGAAAPMAQVLGADVIRANPTLANQTAGQVISSVTRRMGDSTSVGPAAPGATDAGALSFQEAAGISRLLRSELAHRQQQDREAQQGARIGLDKLIQQNLVAAQQGEPPPNHIANEQYAAAGYDPAEKRTQLSVQQHLFTAGADLASADTMERTQQIADRFAVGSPLFMADPKAAGVVLNHAKSRGAQIQHETLIQRVADLTAEAESTGARGAITPEEGMAGGMRPEQIQSINTAISQKADYQQAFQRALRMSPADRAGAVAQLNVKGEAARENKLLLGAYARASEAQAKGLKDDPAGYVLNMSKPAQDLMGRVAQDPQAMGQLLNLLAFEQERLGVPETDRRPLPNDLAKRLVAEMTALPSDHDRLRRLSALLLPVEQDDHRSKIMGQLQEAGLKEHLLIGAAVARRAGDALGARIATELGTDAAKMGIDGTTRKNTVSDVQGVWDSDSRLGGLRRAQTLIAPQLGQQGEHEQRLLEKVALVRQAGTGTYNAREVYTQLFGDRVPINRPGEGVLVTGPQGVDPDQLAAGLRNIRAARIAVAEPNPQRRVALERQGVWLDYGAGRFALYAKDIGVPMAGADGRPIITSTDEALVSAQARFPGGTDFFRAANRRRWRERGGIIPGFSDPETAP